MSKNDELPPLDSLDAKIRQLRSADSTTAETSRGSRGESKAMRCGAELIAGVAVGGFLGYYADDWLGTRPALTIFGIFLGMAGAVMNIYRVVSAEAAQSDDHPTETSLSGSDRTED